MKRTLVRWGTQFLSNIIMILLWYYRGLAQAFLVFCFCIKMLSKQWKLDPIITNYVTLLNSDFFVTTSTLTVPTSFDWVNKQEDNNDNDNQWIKTKTSTLTTWLMIASGGWELNSSNMAAFNVFFIEVRKLTGLGFTKYHSFRVRLIEGRINKSGWSRMSLEYCEQKRFRLEMP